MSIKRTLELPDFDKLKVSLSLLPGLTLDTFGSKDYTEAVREFLLSTKAWETTLISTFKKEDLEWFVKGDKFNLVTNIDDKKDFIIIGLTIHIKHEEGYKTYETRYPFMTLSYSKIEKDLYVHMDEGAFRVLSTTDLAKNQKYLKAIDDVWGYIISKILIPSHLLNFIPNFSE